MNKNELKQKLEKSIEFLKNDIANVRTGRANPSLVSDIVVDAYGSKMTLKELGSITLLDSQTISVTPWDRSLIGAIAKAVREGELNLNPAEDSDRIRIPVPALTEERRIELTKVVGAKGEESKQSIRNIRQDVMKEIEKSFTDKLIGEDEKFTQKDEVEKVVKEYTEQVDKICDSKKQELMTV